MDGSGWYALGIFGATGVMRHHNKNVDSTTFEVESLKHIESTGDMAAAVVEWRKDYIVYISH